MKSQKVYGSSKSMKSQGLSVKVYEVSKTAFTHTNTVQSVRSNYLALGRGCLALPSGLLPTATPLRARISRGLLPGSRVCHTTYTDKKRKDSGQKRKGQAPVTWWRLGKLYCSLGASVLGDYEVCPSRVLTCTTDRRSWRPPSFSDRTNQT